MTWKVGIAVALTTLAVASPSFAQAPGGGPGSGPGGSGPGASGPGGTSGGGSGPSGSPGGGAVTNPGGPSTPNAQTPGTSQDQNMSKDPNKGPCPTGQTRSKTTQMCQASKKQQPKS
jgi:hypothetical protein